MAKHKITIPYRGILFEITVSEPAILSIRKVFEDSGISRDVKWDETPSAVKELILEQIQKPHGS